MHNGKVQDLTAYGIISAVFLVGVIGILVLPAGIPASYRPPEITAPGPFSILALEAKSAYVLDMTTGQALYEKNADAQLPLASLTKIMTARVAAGILSDESVVPITSEAVAVESPSGLREGQQWNFKKLLDYTLMVSANDGATAIAAAAAATLQHQPADAQDSSDTASFIALMNETAQKLGLTQTFFLNPTGLDVSTSTSGAYGSAHDVAVLLASTYQSLPHLLEATREENETVTQAGTTYTARNTDEIAGRLPGLVAGKTGYTDLAGGNLAVITDIGVGHPVAIVVLGSSKDGRFTDVEQLAEASRKAIHLALP